MCQGQDTIPKTDMARSVEKHDFLIGDISTPFCHSLVFRGVNITEKRQEELRFHFPSSPFSTETEFLGESKTLGRDKKTTIQCFR